MTNLIEKVRSCTLCQDLPLGPRPILQYSADAKILIAGQAPGRITHHKGIPFDDPSGERLRDWMGIDRAVFYDAKKIAIIPMGFCFPGTGKNGDLPPRTICAETWHQQLLTSLPKLELTLIIGRYALDWHLKPSKQQTLTNIVNDWPSYLPSHIPLPHPSPRNNRWLKNNPWFEETLLPILKQRVQSLLD
ncbi:uracil-DNA glycosylase family protein [Kangiella sp. HZ709]|uniref:uracil-DNA glycosylase family protein n=1 Tax=Kangiella sp. HZ709 TaxID=2666328 RepID=UPI0012B01E8C|nr:uracil-DNA glycosylase family protein [Kangiella sp. HZ709]MRX27865.1 uracil-DNA glycosylase family protein [Kangiella sp. HZ709]